MTFISSQDNSKGPKPGKAGPDTGKFGPGFKGGSQKSAAQDVDPSVPLQGTCGGNTVKDPMYMENAQTAGN